MPHLLPDEPLHSPVEIAGETVSGPVSRVELVAVHIHRRACHGCRGGRFNGKHKPPGQWDLERAQLLLDDLDRLFGVATS